MTRIFVNAVSLREGGSLVVLRELQAAMTRLRPAWHWQVCTNAEARAQLPDFPQTQFLVVPDSALAGWKVRWWYESELPRLVRAGAADLLFSQTNYLPWRRMSCPEVLLVQHAGHFSALFSALTEAQTALPGKLAWRMKTRWVRASVRKAEAVTVQTAALAAELVAATAIGADRITVIPHGPGLIRPGLAEPVFPAPGQPLRIGYITKYGVQKNFRVLFAAAARLRQQGVDARLVLTLDQRTAQSQAVLAQAQALGVGELVENHGELDQSAIARLYAGLHVFVFPSLCESFGFPQVEALTSGLPLLVADTPANREVAGAAALPFPPHDDAALARLIVAIGTNKAAWQQRVEQSLQRAQEFSWERAAVATVALLEKSLVKGRKQ